MWYWDVFLWFWRKLCRGSDRLERKLENSLLASSSPSQGGNLFLSPYLRNVKNFRSSLDWFKITGLWQSLAGSWGWYCFNGSARRGPDPTSVQMCLETGVMTKLFELAVSRHFPYSRDFASFAVSRYFPYSEWCKKHHSSGPLRKVSRNGKTTKSFVGQKRFAHDLEYGKGGHWIRKVSRNRKTTKSFVVSINITFWGHRMTL